MSNLPAEFIIEESPIFEKVENKQRVKGINKNFKTPKETYIYALCNPKTDEIRYVGKTANLEKRYETHCYFKGKTRVSCWIKSIKPNKPKLVVLESIEPYGNWQEAEQFWIAYFKFLGARLTNHSSGGEGNVDFEHSEETKARISEKLKGNQHLLNHVLSEETIEKLREAGKKRKHTEEEKIKITIANTGVIFSKERLRKMSESQMEHERSKESIEKQKETIRNRTSEQRETVSAKLSASRKDKKHSKETRAKMSASAKALPPKSVEWCAKISASKKNKPVSEETKEKIRIANTGKKRTAETREKMKKPKSEEHKANLKSAWWKRRAKGSSDDK